MQRTEIRYLTHTWNPIAMRCTPVSEGCDHCWHLRYCDRMKNNRQLPQNIRDAYAGGLPVLKQAELIAPAHLRKPSIIGVQFMGDWMHPRIPPVWIDCILDIVSSCKQHLFLSLTKRPERLQEMIYGVTQECGCRELGGGDYLPNLINGVTVETQARADERIPALLQIPGAHWISIEPCLGDIDLSGLQPRACNFGPRLHFTTLGCETGPGARPMQLTWARSVRDQCMNMAVPFHLKTINGHEILPMLDGRRHPNMPPW